MKKSSRRKTYSKLKRKLQEIDQSNIEDCIEVWQPENPLIYGLEDRDHIMESSDIVNTPPLKVEMDHSSNEVIIDSHSIKDEPNRFSKAYSSLSSSQDAKSNVEPVFDSIEQARSDSESKLSELEILQQELKEKLAQSERLLAEQTVLTNSVRDEYGSRAADILARETSLSHLQRDFQARLSCAQANEKDLEEQLSILQNVNISLTKTIASLQAQLVQIQSELREHENQAESLVIISKDLIQEKVEYAQRSQFFQQQAKQLSDQAAKLEQQLDSKDEADLTAWNEATRTRKSLEHKVHAAEEGCRERDIIISQLQEQLAHRDAMISDLTKSSDAGARSESSQRISF